MIQREFPGSLLIRLPLLGSLYAWPHTVRRDVFICLLLCRLPTCRPCDGLWYILKAFYGALKMILMAFERISAATLLVSGDSPDPWTCWTWPMGVEVHGRGAELEVLCRPVSFLRHYNTAPCPLIGDMFWHILFRAHWFCWHFPHLRPFFFHILPQPTFAPTLLCSLWWIPQILAVQNDFCD